MAYEMSRPARCGHNLAASHTVFAEASLEQIGLPPVSAQGMSPEQMVAKAEFWMTQLRAHAADVSGWAQLSSLAAQCAGDLHVREEMRVDTGDAEELAA